MKKRILSLLFGLILIMGVSSSHAAGILTPKGSTGAPILIRDHHVNIVINNGFAMTEVHQTFYNPNDKDLEAIYRFPLPKSASLSEVTIYAGEQEINGEVLEKQKARQIYEEEKNQGNEAGLAGKNEFYTFEYSVYPVPATAETKIRFLYYQPLKIDTGVGRYLYPLEDGGTDEAGMDFWTTNAKIENTFSVDLELKSAWPVQDVRAPGFEAAANINTVGDGHVKLDMQLTDMQLNRDFVFYYRLADNLPGRVEVIPFRDDPDNPGTFMMVITPGEDLKPLTNGSDYCFVLDISGSMQSKLWVLKKGVVKALEKLSPDDRFRLVTFSNGAEDLTKGWMTMSAENLVKAKEIIEALKVKGSTNMYSGLALGLKNLNGDRANHIILVTDAVTNTGIVKPKAFYDLLTKVDVRVYGFLLGNSANWPLMKTVTETSGGFYDSISNADDIMGKIMLAGGKINYEALIDAKVSVSGVKVFDVTDDAFRKVYRGEQLVLFGKYEKGGDARVTLEAGLTGEDKTYTTAFSFPDTDSDNPELERLWALAMIENFESQERIGKMQASESETAVRDLGLDYQIVTDYTSMVVLSDAAFSNRGIGRRNQKRIVREQQARAVKSSKPVKSYRVDKEKPAFKFKAPDIGGGGGAIDPFTGIMAFFLSIFGVLRFAGNPRKRQ
jgi:Ca-activated chloride channel homolog